MKLQGRPLSARIKSYYTGKSKGPKQPHLLSPSTPALLPHHRHSPNTPPWPAPSPKRPPLSRPLLRGPWVSGWGRLAQLCREPCCHKRLGWQPLTLHNVPLTGHRATSWVTSLQQAAPGEAECPPPPPSPPPPPPLHQTATPAPNPPIAQENRETGGGRWREEVLYCAGLGYKKLSTLETTPGSRLGWARHCWLLWYRRCWQCGLGSAWAA